MLTAFSQNAQKVGNATAFNSLFEMRIFVGVLGGGWLGGLSILYLRCSGVMPPPRASALTSPFNSLFEMRPEAPPVGGEAAKVPFNSLFEMQTARCRLREALG